MLTLFQKRIEGSLFGASSPTKDIPRMLDLYRAGQLHLDELITKTYRLEDINQGYADMRDGLNIRGIVAYDRE
jgi:S-(hydroxymethyl)glutathione dehydrogenase/alcohol dehydrogenase